MENVMTAPSYTYTLINPPLPSDITSAPYVSANQINDLGQVIGTISNGQSYGTPSGKTYSFIYDKGTYTILQAPGAYSTTISQINHANEVIGHYVDAAGTHSFAYTNGTYTEIAYPGASFTNVVESSSSGKLVGTFFDSGGLHAFLDENGSYTALSVPGSTSTTPVAVNAAGQVIGNYTDSNGSHAFLYSNHAYTTLSEPGAPSVTVQQINDAGQILGSYSTGYGPPQSFVYLNGTYTQINVPGSAYTSALELNGNGQVAGTYYGQTGSHVFIETNGNYIDVEPKVTSSGNQPAYYSVNFTAFNNRGEVLGSMYGPSQSGPFIYSDDSSGFLGAQGGASMSFTGINDLGQLIGTFSDGYSTHAFLATPAPGAATSFASTETIGANSSLLPAIRPELAWSDSSMPRHAGIAGVPIF